MNNYEAMFIVKPDLSEEEKKALFNQLQEAVAKLKGNVSSAAVWGEKRRLFFPIRKHNEAVYFLMQFALAPAAVKELNRAYKLNENVLRVLITCSQ
jgi:small subunit ribosomal protein S6